MKHAVRFVFAAAALAVFGLLVGAVPLTVGLVLLAVVVAPELRRSP